MHTSQQASEGLSKRCAQKLPCFAVRSCRNDYLHIRSDHVGDPTYLRVAPQLVRARAPLFPTVAQGFDCYINTDLVSVLKTIRYRLRRAINLHHHAFKCLLFDALRECFAREAHDIERRQVIVTFAVRAVRFTINRYPHLKGHLSSQAVKAECREETYYAARHALCGFD